MTLFAFDSAEELEKLAEHAPGARVYCRILVENEGAEWPLSRKFGTTIESARDLMVRAGEMGLDPYGLSFHVGSQQTTTRAYEVAIAKVAMLFTDLTEAGVNLRMMNLGGGFPTRYRDPVPEIDQFGDAIMTSMTEHFGNALPEMLIEPGRFIVGDAGVVECRSGAGQPARSERSGALGVSRHRPFRRAGGNRGRGDQVSHRHAARRRPWGRWRSRAQPATARTSCMRSRTTGCRWH